MAWKDVDEDLTSNENIVGTATVTITDCTDGTTWTSELVDVIIPDNCDKESKNG